MKKYLTKKKTIALICSLSLLLTSCGGGEKTEPTTEDKASTSNVEETKTEETKTEETKTEEESPTEKPTITFMLPGMQGNELKTNNSDLAINMYEEYTGTKVDWRFENNGTYKETFGLTLMDRDNMPMILTASGELTANVVDAAKKGAFWDLTDYLKDSEKFPNLSQANPNVLKALTVDGKIVGVYRARPIGRYGLSYRTDWAEAVGITEEPKTADEVYDMMYKFAHEDPDGNGADDTYALELTKYVGPFDIMQTWFGVGNEWVEQDGKLIPVHQTKEYREALKFFQKMYNEGLIRKDWATIDTSGYSDAVKKGEAGMFIDVMDSGKRIWEYFASNDVKSVTNPDELASMNLLGEVNEKTLATSGFNGYYLITKAGAKTEEDLINCLTFLDKMCDDEMMALASWGIEGITYEFDENGETRTIEGVDVAAESPSRGLNQAVAFIPNLDPVSIPRYKNEQTKASDAAIEDNMNYVVYNPALGYLANSTVNAEVGTDIEQIIDDARTQYICGQLDDAGLDKIDQQWLDRGGDRLIEEINALYQADNK